MSAEPDPQIQPATPPPRLSMRQFWRELADELFSLDRGLPWTAWRMTRAPGALVRDFVQARDARVVRPLRYFLVGLASLALVFQATGAGESAYLGFIAGFRGGREGTEAAAEAVWWVLSHVEWWLIGALLPAMALATRHWFRREQPNFAEMWVLGLYVAGQAMLVLALLFVVEALLQRVELGASVLAVPPGYFLATCLGYFGGRWPGRVLRALLALATTLALAGVFLMAVIVAVASSANLFATP